MSNGQERRADNAKLAEQVAVLESIIARMQEDIDALALLLKEHMEKEETERKELMDKLDILIKEQTRYKGVIGGVILTVSGLFAIYEIAGNLIKKLLT